MALKTRVTSPQLAFHPRRATAGANLDVVGGDPNTVKPRVYPLANPQVALSLQRFHE